MGKRDSQNINALNIRVWYTEKGVRVDRPPVFLAHGKFSGDPSQSMGDSTSIKAPDPNNFERDIEIGTVKGTKERATFSIADRYFVTKDTLQRLARTECQVDWYAMIGKCGNPQDFSRGGEKKMFFPDGQISNRALENFGAFGTDENNPTNSMIDVNSEDFYEFIYEKVAQIGSATTTREVRTIDVYLGQDCDECSDGCQKIFATMVGTGATPGTVPVLLYSDDNGVTWNVQNIDSMFSTENIMDAIFIGGDFVLVTNTGVELHYTNVDDVYIGENTWQQNDGGFVAAGAPNAITSTDPSHTWVVGDAGYVYFLRNHRMDAVVQDAGVQTAQNLNAVHACDKENVLAVGNSNAVLITRNGGETWEAITGPSVGVNLSSCWMWDEDVWFIAEGAGGAGRLWYTLDGGYNWTEKELPTTLSQIDKIIFVDGAEGYLVGRSGGQSYILRTITGGYEWITLPDGKDGVFPDNSYIRDLSACPTGLNTVFGAGLADNGTAGFIVKAEG